MSRQESPYITNCGFCEQGLLRFMRCPDCSAVCAVCDECELIWRDIAAVHQEPACASSSSYPKCPACSTASQTWTKLDAEGVSQAELQSYVSGESG